MNDLITINTYLCTLKDEFMNTVEQKKYIKDFKAYSKKVNANKSTSGEFLVRAGINTPKGKLTKKYTSSK